MMKNPFKNKQSLTEKELATLASLAKRILWDSPDLRARLQREHKVNITPANFYSNIPLVDDIESSFEYRSGNEQAYGALFDQPKMEAFARKILEFADEFNPPLEGDRSKPDGYFWKNPAFSFLDAMSYYCMVRFIQPKHILEIGSGFSTLVADQAIQKNGFGEITLIEPYPMDFLREIPSVSNIIEKFVQDIPIAEALELIDRSELWFIDSTHTVKIGSDCLYIYLQLMPRVSTQTMVHTHDVFIPFGMPKDKALEKHIYWTEQYLLYAYLLDNPKGEIVFGSAYTHQVLKDIGKALMGGKYPTGGGSLWYWLNLDN